MTAIKPGLLVSFKTPLESLGLGLLLALAFLSKVPNESISILGSGFMMIVFFIGTSLAFLYVVRRGGVPRVLLVLSVCMTAICVIYMIALIRRVDFEGAKNVFILTCLMIYLFTVSTIKWHPKEFNSLIMAFACFTIPSVIALITHVKIDSDETWLGNTNYLGALSYFSSAFLCIYCSKKVQSFRGLFRFHFVPYHIIFFVQLTAIFLSKARGVWIATIITLLTFWLWPYITKHRLFYFLFIALLVALSVLIVYVTVSFPLVSLLDGLNDLSSGISSKNIESGRERIWPMILNLIYAKPLIGYGAGALPSTMTTIELSAHNYYLQVLLQVGFVGLGGIALMLAEIWNLFFISKSSLTTRIIGSFFAGTIVHQNFEVSLTQNNIAMGILIFTLFGIGISESICQFSQSPVPLLPIQRTAP